MLPARNLLAAIGGRDMPFIPKQVYIDAEIEERPGPISVYRTANGGTSSRELRQGLLRRWERWREVFSIDGANGM